MASGPRCPGVGGQASAGVHNVPFHSPLTHTHTHTGQRTRTNASTAAMLNGKGFHRAVEPAPSRFAQQGGGGKRKFST